MGSSVTTFSRSVREFGEFGIFLYGNFEKKMKPDAICQLNFSSDYDIENFSCATVFLFFEKEALLGVFVVKTESDDHPGHLICRESRDS